MGKYSKPKNREEVEAIGNEVVGYFAYLTVGKVFCEKRACIIGSSEEAMNKYLNDRVPSSVGKHHVKSTTFREIFNGMMGGGAYCFDEPAYNRFCELALKAGMGNKGLGKFKEQCPTGSEFARVGGRPIY